MAGMSTYTFTSIHGRDYPILAAQIESRENTTTSQVMGQVVTKYLSPLRSTFGDVIAERPCFPVVSGLGPDCALEGTLHGGSFRCDCCLFCVRHAPDGHVAYHFVDVATYTALGGFMGRGTEWPIPELPYVPRAKVKRSDMPNGMFGDDGMLRIKNSDN